jgi:hypothetical protein
VGEVAVLVVRLTVQPRVGWRPGGIG